MDLGLVTQLRLWQQQPGKAVLEALTSSKFTLHPDAQTLVLSALVNPICQVLPPNSQYIKRITKQLIQVLEDQGQELDEQFLQLYTALLMPVDSASSHLLQEDSSWRYKTFYYSSKPDLQAVRQLQQQHVANCLAACGLQPCHDHHHHQQLGLMPLAQRQQLHARQQHMAALLVAAGCQSMLNSSNEQHCASCNSTKLHQQQEHTSNGVLDIQAGQHTLLDHQTLQQQHQQAERVSQHQLPPQQKRSAGLLSVHMSDNLFEGGTGCHMWDAGFLLAEFVLNHPQLFAGKRCLEIGSGPGLVGACLARLRPAQLLLTDGDPQTLVNCVSNMAMNGHSVALLGSWQEAVQQQQEQQAGACLQVLACPLDWDADVPGLWADVIVGSDILYDPLAVPSVVCLLTQLLGAETQSTQTQEAQSLPDQHQTRQTQGAATTAVSAETGHQCLPVVGATSGDTAATDIAYVHAKRCASVAYLSTTKRQPSTLKLFEDLSKQHGLLVVEISMQLAEWSAEPVMFQELPALQDREARFVLHRITAL